jgi:hypothetical protein
MPQERGQQHINVLMLASVEQDVAGEIRDLFLGLG